MREGRLLFVCRLGSTRPAVQGVRIDPPARGSVRPRQGTGGEDSARKVVQNARLRERISFLNRRRYAARAARLSHHDFNLAHSRVISRSFAPPSAVPGFIAANAAEGMLTRFAVNDPFRYSGSISPGSCGFDLEPGRA
jgi:hypothetical protein